jgi:isoleucyl-tRNA synthetase
VHLADYPVPTDDAVDVRLEEAMATARAIVELGRRVRVEHRIKTRQPLASAVVHLAGDREALSGVLDVVADELNVKRIGFAETVTELGRWRAKPNFRVLGRRLGSRVQQVASVLADDDGPLANALAQGRSVRVAVDEGELELAPDDVELSHEVAAGYGVASEGGLTVALAVELTDDLRREGVARELIRVIQEARRGAELQVGDRIDLGIEGGPQVAAAVEAHGDEIAAETLAVSVSDEALPGGIRQETQVDGEPVTITVRMAVPRD